MDTYKNRPGFRLALFATLLALVVVLLGAYTRLTHAGLGCPDWPGCYGFISVPQTEAQLAHAEANFPHAPVEAQKGWNEMVHRYFAGTLGLVILGLAIHAVRLRGRDGQPLKLPLLLVAVVVAQAAFGMWTVTLQLWPQVVTAHLLGGFTTLSLLLLLSLRLSNAFPPLQLPQRLRLWAALGLALVIGQIALGGWVSSNYAAVACVDLPTCHGQWWPAMDFDSAFRLLRPLGGDGLGGALSLEALTAIHMAHRLGAVLLSLALLGLAFGLRRAGQPRFALLFVALLALQIVSGISNVVLGWPLLAALGHTVGAAALVLGWTFLGARLRPAPQARLQERFA